MPQVGRGPPGSVRPTLPTNRFYNSIDQIRVNKIGVSFSGNIENHSYDSEPHSALWDRMQTWGVRCVEEVELVWGLIGNQKSASSMRACQCKSTPRTLLSLAEVINMCWLMSKWELNHKCASVPRAGGLAASLALSFWKDSSHGSASFFWWFLKDFTLSSFVYDQTWLPILLVVPLSWYIQNKVITYKGRPGWVSYSNETMGSYTLKKTKQNKTFPISVIYRHVTPWLLIGGVCCFPMGVPKFLASAHRH